MPNPHHGPEREVWRNYRPSNGTEGDFQRAQLCNRCEADHAWHLYYRHGEQAQMEPGESCPIIMDALVGEHAYPNEDGPPQWSYYPDEGLYECSEFAGPCDCDWEREAFRHRPPRVEIPGQMSLW